MPLKYADYFTEVYKKMSILKNFGITYIVGVSNKQLYDPSYILMIKMVLDLGLYLYLNSGNSEEGPEEWHVMTIIGYDEEFFL